MAGMRYQGPRGQVPGVSFTIPAESVDYELPTVLRKAMEDYLRRHSPVAPPDLGRLVITDL